MKKTLMCLVGAVIIGAGACTTDEGSRSATAALSSRPGREASLPSEQPKVVLDHVRYDCGPTDGIVISFEATAEVPFAGRAELVVLDGTYGSVSIDVGPTPGAYLMNVDLTQEAYDAGEGLVRVTSDQGRVIASGPVALRLEPGVACG